MKIYFIFLWISVGLTCPHVFADFVDKQCGKYCKAISEAYQKDNMTLVNRTLAVTKSVMHGKEHYKKWICTFEFKEGDQKVHYEVFLSGYGVLKGALNKQTVRMTSISKHILKDVVPVGEIHYKNTGVYFLRPTARYLFAMFVHVTKIKSSDFFKTKVIN